jgi:hypothetical protein
MPPRYSYWTIIAGGLPTAFRAAEREDLLPTYARLREKHPDARMKWFARGKLWDSPAAARADLDARRAKPGRPPRKREWRPGGEHRDPRQPFKDAKKARNRQWRERKFTRKRDGDQKSPGGSRRPFKRRSFERNERTPEPPTQARPTEPTLPAPPPERSLRRKPRR